LSKVLFVHREPRPEAALETDARSGRALLALTKTGVKAMRSAEKRQRQPVPV